MGIDALNFIDSKGQFVCQLSNARILFVQGDDGKVQKLNLEVAGQKKDAPRIEWSR